MVAFARVVAVSFIVVKDLIRHLRPATTLASRLKSTPHAVVIRGAEKILSASREMGYPRGLVQTDRDRERLLQSRKRYEYHKTFTPYCVGVFIDHGSHELAGPVQDPPQLGGLS